MSPRTALRSCAAFLARPTRTALLLLLFVAAAIRLVLLARQWPASNSDEATMGLMAMHIAEGRDFPDFMYGQSYMGSEESYLAAAVIRLFGPSLIALRLPMVLSYLLFLLVLYVLARRLYGTGVALVSVGVLTLGSRELFGYESVTEGAITETLLTGTVLLLLGHRLLETAGHRDGATRRRWSLFGWGLAATFGLWSTMLVAPFVLTSGALVWLGRRRRAGPAGRSGAWCLAAGLLLGAAPWLTHDLTHPFDESSVRTLVDLYVHGGTGLNGERSPGLLTQMTNTVTTSLAYITGGSAIAHPHSPPAWPLGFSESWRPPTDSVVATVWGLVVIVLWATGLRGELRSRRAGRRSAQLYGRLAMLISAALTTAAFAASPTPGVAPANNARYLVGVLVATPALIAALLALRPAASPYARAVRWGGLGVVVLTLVLGTGQALRDATHGDGDADSRQLVQALQVNGVRHFYTSYTDCNRLIFISRERMICAVLFQGPGDSLRPGFDRYLPYRAAVEADPAAAYVFRSGDPRNETLARSACQWQRHWRLVGYEVWQPAEPCAVAT